MIINIIGFFLKTIFYNTKVQLYLQTTNIYNKNFMVPNKELDEIILEFIRKNYCVSRIKQNARFKRAIVIDDTTYMLSDKHTTFAIKQRIVNHLKIIFDCSAYEAELFITKSLNI